MKEREKETKSEKLLYYLEREREIERERAKDYTH